MIHDCRNGNVPVVSSSQSAIQAQPTLKQVYTMFGPTHSGHLQTINGSIEYTLEYPGLQFVFHIPDEYKSLYEDQSTHMPPDDH